MDVFGPEMARWFASSCPPLARQVAVPATLIGFVWWLLVHGVAPVMGLAMVVVGTLCAVMLLHPRELITVAGAVFVVRRLGR